MKAWQRLDDGSDVVDVKFRPIVKKRFRMNDGTEISANISSAEGNTASIVYALTPENRVIVARQFRCGPEKVMDEMPAGAVDPGETPEQAAHREMLEETGYATDELELLGAAYVNAWDNSLHYYYLARNCYQVEGATNPEESEEIEIDTISIAEFFDSAKHARMTDTQGVFLVYDKLKELEGETHETTN